MLPEVQNLLVIQDRDQRIAALNEELQRLPIEEDAAKLRLNGDKMAVADIDQKIKENEVAIKNLELDIDTRKDTIAKLKVQQFETRKNEEFSALGTEIVRYGDEITKLEDSELELMEAAEEMKAELAAAKDALAKTQGVVDTELGIIDKRRTECESQLEETKADRAKLAAEIDEDQLDEYERIFSSKSGTAVVELVDGICKGCHMKVIGGVAAATRQAQAITHCDQCNRILYLS